MSLMCWWQAYSRPSPPLSEGWKGYIVMAHAVIDSEAAWSEAQQLTSFDDGNTLSNTLYWIASREGAAEGRGARANLGRVWAN